MSKKERDARYRASAKGKAAQNLTHRREKIKRGILKQLKDSGLVDTGESHLDVFVSAILEVCEETGTNIDDMGFDLDVVYNLVYRAMKSIPPVLTKEPWKSLLHRHHRALALFQDYGMKYEDAQNFAQSDLECKAIKRFTSMLGLGIGIGIGGHRDHK